MMLSRASGEQKIRKIDIAICENKQHSCSEITDNRCATYLYHLCRKRRQIARFGEMKKRLGKNEQCPLKTDVHFFRGDGLGKKTNSCLAVVIKVNGTLVWAVIDTVVYSNWVEKVFNNRRYYGYSAFSYSCKRW